MTRYIDLDDSHKRTLLVNQGALAMAIALLVELTGKEKDIWIEHIWKGVYEDVSGLTYEQVNALIQTFENNDPGFDSEGVVVEIQDAK